MRKERNFVVLKRTDEYKIVLINITKEEHDALSDNIENLKQQKTIIAFGNPHENAFSLERYVEKIEFPTERVEKRLEFLESCTDTKGTAQLIIDEEFLVYKCYANKDNNGQYPKSFSDSLVAPHRTAISSFSCALGCLGESEFILMFNDVPDEAVTNIDLEAYIDFGKTKTEEV